jgi:hypothetical protein
LKHGDRFPFCLEAVGLLPEILEEPGDSPALFFIDPFGNQGAELSTLQMIARTGHGREVLVRFDDTRLKRLIRLVANHRGSLDPMQRRIAEALSKPVAQFASASDVEQTLALLDANERVASREALVDAYRKVVVAKNRLHAWSGLSASQSENRRPSLLYCSLLLASGWLYPHG